MRAVSQKLNISNQTEKIFPNYTKRQSKEDMLLRNILAHKHLQPSIRVDYLTVSM